MARRYRYAAPHLLLHVGLLSGVWTVAIWMPSSSRLGVVVVEGGTTGAGDDRRRRRKEKEKRKRAPHARFFSSFQQQQQQQQQQHQEREGRRRRGGSGTNQWGQGEEGFAFPLNATTSTLSLLFPTHQPRHVAEGVANLLQSLTAGLTLGLTSLLALPAAGFRDGGWPGLCAGGLTGILYGTLFAVLGVVNGVWQLVRGAVITPRAVQAARQGGRLWNTTSEQWQVYHLQDEYDQLLLLRHQQRTSSSSSSIVKDDSYYRRLAVPVTASTAEIKRAYYRMARAVHPDKNPNDAAAAEQFRQLHAAYLVLSDEDQRWTYNRLGPPAEPSSAAAEGIPNSNHINIPRFDPHVFFAILFHSSLVEAYVGALTVAFFTDQLLQLARTNAPPEECWQLLLGREGSMRTRQRQVEIALHLQHRTNAYRSSSSSSSSSATTTGSGTEQQQQLFNRDDDAYYESCRAEARHIAASGPFGPRFLAAIGSALVLEAQQRLGFHQSFFTGVFGLVRKRARRYKSAWSLTQQMFGLFKTLIQTLWNNNSTTTTPGPPPDFENIVLPRLIDVTWAFNEMDIQEALQGACLRLFADTAGGDDDRTVTRTKQQQQQQRRTVANRATAVRLLGEAFLEVAAAAAATPHRNGTQSETADEDQDQLMSRVQIAFLIASQDGKQNFDEDVENVIQQHAHNKRLLEKRQRTSRRK